MPNITSDVVRKYTEAGLCALPAVRAAKRPATGSWTTWRQRLPTTTEVSAWFANPVDAVCILTGTISGNLECLDFDQHGELFDAWSKAIPAELLSRLFTERTPSGGYHAVYRSTEPVEGNRKLAQGERNGKLATLIETRGEGGLFLCAPTEGYVALQGSLDMVPEITPEERDLLLSAAVALNEREYDDKTTHSTAAFPDATDFDVRPGDDFNARGDIRPYLQNHGWNFSHRQGDNEYWTRPGKKVSDGHSASFDGKTLYVFSSSAAPFEPGRAYTPFQVYALLEHDGDFRQAAASLLDRGFGASSDPRDGVDLSAFMKKEEPGPEADDALVSNDPGPLPSELLDVPGFVNSLAGYTMDTAPYPNRVLAFTGALAMLAMLTGRKYVDAFGNRTNIYLIALADSGTGKDHPRKTNFKLAATLGLLDCTADTFASGEGLEDAIQENPVMLFMSDEFDSIFNNMKQRDARAESMNSALLRFYSEAGGIHCMRARAKDRRHSSFDTEDAARKIINPHLVLLGTAVPRYFYEALTRRVMENGLIARCVVIEAGDRGDLQRPKNIPFPPDVLDAAAHFRDIRFGSESIPGQIVPYQIPETDEGAEAFDRVAKACDDEARNADEADELTASALWRRANEKIRKFAMLHALSRDYAEPVIRDDDVLWAHGLVAYTTRKTLFSGGLYVNESFFDEMANKVVRRLMKRNGRMSHAALLRRSHLDRDTFKKVMDTLAEGGVVVKTHELTGQRQSTFYTLARKSGGEGA